MTHQFHANVVRGPSWTNSLASLKPLTQRRCFLGAVASSTTQQQQPPQQPSGIASSTEQQVLNALAPPLVKMIPPTPAPRVDDNALQNEDDVAESLDEDLHTPTPKPRTTKLINNGRGFVVSTAARYTKAFVLDLSTIDSQSPTASSRREKIYRRLEPLEAEMSSDSSDVRLEISRKQRQSVGSNKPTGMESTSSERRQFQLDENETTAAKQYLGRDSTTKPSMLHFDPIEFNPRELLQRVGFTAGALQSVGRSSKTRYRCDNINTGKFVAEAKRENACSRWRYIRTRDATTHDPMGIYFRLSDICNALVPLQPAEGSVYSESHGQDTANKDAVRAQSDVGKNQQCTAPTSAAASPTVQRLKKNAQLDPVDLLASRRNFSGDGDDGQRQDGGSKASRHSSLRDQSREVPKAMSDVAKENGMPLPRRPVRADGIYVDPAYLETPEIPEYRALPNNVGNGMYFYDTSGCNRGFGGPGKVGGIKNKPQKASAAAAGDNQQQRQAANPHNAATFTAKPQLPPEPKKQEPPCNGK